MKKIYALFMTLCLVISATAAPLAGTVKGSYPLNTKVVTSAKQLSLDATMQKAPAATQGLQYDATEGDLIRYYNESDALSIDTTYASEGQLSIRIVASDNSDLLSLVLFAESTVPGTIIPEGTYPITSEPAYGTAYASPGVQNGSVYPSFYGMLNSKGQILTPLYFLESGNVVVEVVDGNLKISIDAANSNNVPMTIVYEVGGKSEKVEVKGPLKYDATEADGALDVTYGADATVQLSNGDGYSILTVASPDATNEVDLAFFYDAADPETVIPAGTYTIDDSYTPGTVLASTGVNNQGQVSLSFYANLDEEGYLVTPIYFLVSGTVEVTNVDGQLKVEVNAVNSNNVPIHIVYDATPAEPTVEVMELTMTNLQVSNYGEATGLWASDMDNGIEVMLFLDAEGNLMEESSIMVSWMDYTVTGTVTKAYDEELATDVYTAELYTTVGETNYKLIITMYYVPVEATPVVVENATIDDQTETSGFMFMTGEWTDAEGVVYPVSAEVPGFDATVAEAVYSNVTVTVGGWGDEDPWLGFVQGDATITVVENVVTLTGVMSSWDGLTLDVTISGSLPAIAPETITWELNGGEFPAVVVPTNAELWEAFKPYYNTYYGLTRADQPIDKVSTFANAKMQEIMTDEASEYKWLGDYVLSVATAAGVTLSTDMASANESGWRWAVHAFFNAAEGQYGAAGINFTEAGKQEVWGAAYEAEYGVVLPTEPVAEDYTLPTPVKEGYTFVGWYDNAEGEGEAMTVLPAGWAGTLYAIWAGTPTGVENTIVAEQPVKIVRNGQILIIKNGVKYNVLGSVVE